LAAYLDILKDRETCPIFGLIYAYEIGRFNNRKSRKGLPWGMPLKSISTPFRVGDFSGFDQKA
jgi:hypothetical protein